MISRPPNTSSAPANHANRSLLKKSDASAPIAGARSAMMLEIASPGVRTGLPPSRSWRTRLPGAAAVEEQVDAIIGPSVGLSRGHRRAEAEGAALRQGHDELEELLGGELRAVDRQGASARLAVEHGGNLADHLGPAAFACDDRDELRKALRLGYQQPVERERHRHQRGAQQQPCQAPQHLLQIAALVERRAGRRP